MSEAIDYSIVSDCEMTIIPTAGFSFREGRMTPIAVHIAVIHAHLSLIETICKLRTGNRLFNAEIVLGIVIKVSEILPLQFRKEIDEVYRLLTHRRPVVDIRPIHITILEALIFRPLVIDSRS